MKNTSKNVNFRQRSTIFFEVHATTISSSSFFLFFSKIRICFWWRRNFLSKHVVLKNNWRRSVLATFGVKFKLRYIRKMERMKSKKWRLDVEKNRYISIAIAARNLFRIFSKTQLDFFAEIICLDGVQKLGIHGHDIIYRSKTTTLVYDILYI